jgi:oxygen-independent coproporphyrinogen-3 oxidase
MTPELIARYDRRVPRYTSYPTAPNFSPDVDGETYRRWLGEIAPDTAASLYLHIPFCHAMCWYCGCNTKVTRRLEPVAAYANTLIAEIEATEAALAHRLDIAHVHFGGGSPNMLAPGDLIRLIAHLRDRFTLDADAVIAIEIDPRSTTDAFIDACAQAGVTRVSIGVQNLNRDVQKAVNRIQPLALIERIFARLSDAGIRDINVDLMYGLPRQTDAGIMATIDQILPLGPAQISLFGYAHVPWMKKHMRLIDEAALPDAQARWAQHRAAGGRLIDAGYIPIGMDHFARPGSVLARAAASGALHRNFQGYTADTSPVLLGFGASAIGRLPQGYVQNDSAVAGWGTALRDGRFATRRGIALSDDDRIRRAIIERLMCDMTVNVDAVVLDHGGNPGEYVPMLEKLSDMARDGLVTIAGATVRMTPRGRPLVRAAAAAFDGYLDAPEDAALRHVSAI